MVDLMGGLKASELPNDDLKFLEEVIGLEAVQKLLLHAPGLSFYIPTRLPAGFVRKYVLLHYSEAEKNSRALAKKLRISERHVWRILAEVQPPRGRAVA